MNLKKNILNKLGIQDKCTAHDSDCIGGASTISYDALYGKVPYSSISSGSTMSMPAKSTKNWYKPLKKELAKVGLIINHEIIDWSSTENEYVITNPKNNETVKVTDDFLIDFSDFWDYKVLAERMKRYLSTEEAVARRI